MAFVDVTHVADRTLQMIMADSVCMQAHSKEDYQAANQKSAGHPATQIVSYNIIHGAPATALNPHDAWTAGYNYRRKKY